LAIASSQYFTQKGVEVRIGIVDGCVFERLLISNLIDAASEYDPAAKE
jgi:hypothetical protein